MLNDADQIILRLKQFQQTARDAVIRSHAAGMGHAVSRSTAADTIFAIDAEIDPLIEVSCEQWAREAGPLVLVAEGLTDTAGNDVESRVFPDGALDADAAIRLIVDPIDGTRGIMYDKRSAWSLAGVAPNRGAATRLRDIEAAVMTELPTSKAGAADVLWATKGGGAHGERVDLRTGAASPLKLAPSRAADLSHGFASVAAFFPAAKRMAAELMEQIAVAACGPIDPAKAGVFDDQYISTGGQWYELIVGHDRFIADLRPAFYARQRQPPGLCCHPYDCATLLIAEEAGVIITDLQGHPLDGPFDTTTGLNWCAYANEPLRQTIEPVVQNFFHR